MYEGNKSCSGKKVGARLNLNGVDWSVAACRFPDDTVLLAEREETSESGRSISLCML